MKTGELKRVFTIKIGNNSQVLEDPNPALSAEDVKELYSTQYPELLNSQIINKGVEYDKIQYEFATVAGTKG